MKVSTMQLIDYEEQIKYVYHFALVTKISRPQRQKSLANISDKWKMKMQYVLQISNIRVASFFCD